jgi:hypothetical protein
MQNHSNFGGVGFSQRNPLTREDWAGLVNHNLGIGVKRSQKAKKEIKTTMGKVLPSEILAARLACAIIPDLI